MTKSLLQNIKNTFKDYDNLTGRIFEKKYSRDTWDLFNKAEELSYNMAQKDNRLSRTNIVYLTLTTNRGEK